MRLFLVTSLKACAKEKDLYEGSRIHADIRTSGLLETDAYLRSTLVTMYAKCSALVRAQQVIDELRVRDAVSWSALIAGYVQHGHGKEAVGCFYRMQREGLSPNAFTYSSILKACGIMQDINMGEQIHDEIVSLGCFQRMRSEGFTPTAITYACILKACGIMQDVDVGKKIHDEIVSQGLLKNTIMHGNALIDMYAKCGVILKAQMVFDTLPVRDVVSWNALIAGYAQYGQGQEAHHCFQLMRSMGFSPNVVSWTALIGGYAQQGLAKEALDCFQWMQQGGHLPRCNHFC
ncbi:hypothetical protein GOP47_0018235 [Adiantum capillus-veneris]|uniref:Pentatricopeptide repeat-containing protein n=1 Tax=Adiantum capillus-veneris TaxID=13818 RepID=A0A9D4UHD4_ADICA|nr:hypothetical protein GOP47_0018235 [Adiantum capillus-veneris]